MSHLVAISIALVAVLVIATAAIAQVRNKQLQTTRETFVDFAATTPEYLKAVYKEKGVEPCTTISSSNYMSLNYIDSLRFRKWKPQESDPRYPDFAATMSNNDYCYFFMDGDKQILKTEDAPNGYASVIDPLANVVDCSKRNPLFKDVNMIQDIFESTGYDQTHNLPYKKCVLKIDKQMASDPKERDKLWNNMGGSDANAFCEGISNTLMAEANAYQERLESLHQTLTGYRAKYMSLSALNTSLKECTQKNDDLRSTITASNDKLATLQFSINKQNEQLSGTITQLQDDLTKAQRELEIKVSELTGLKNQLEQVTRVELNAVTKASQATAEQRNKCRSQHSLTAQQLAQARAALDALTASYRKLTVDHAACERSLKEVLRNMETQRPILVDVQEKLAVLQDQFKVCRATQVVLLDELDHWKKMVNTTRKNLDLCTNALAKAEAEISSLQKTRDALIAEIEDIKKRCRDDQSNFNMATVDIHRKAAEEIISTEQQRCAASIAMRKRRTELLNEIQGILSQANSCDRIMAQCKCYKRVATFGWNERNSSGARLYTTSGRVDEVRKHLGGAPYIKFFPGGADKEPARITKTRRKKNGGSYIDIAGGYKGSPGMSTAVMYQQV